MIISKIFSIKCNSIRLLVRKMENNLKGIWNSWKQLQYKSLFMLLMIINYFS